jgi:hypothetical protein
VTARTYNELFDPPVRLTLHRTKAGWHSVTDQHGQLYFPPTRDLHTCLRFLKAAREKKDALVDLASVERVAWEAAQEATYSVRVPDAIVRSLTDQAPARSDQVPDNVIAFRRGA